MSADQLTMFEPQGLALVHLSQLSWSIAQTESRRSENLRLSGYPVVAASRAKMAAEALATCEICEIACQFEKLAGLS